jgi:hypothetical protein
MWDVGGGTVIITADYYNHYWQVTTQIRWGAEARFVLAMHSPRKEGRGEGFQTQVFSTFYLDFRF